MSTSPAVLPPAAVPKGLGTAEVRERVAAGAVNVVSRAPSRTVGDILRANLLTRFNALLGGLLAVILVIGPIQDAAFGIVLVANSLVGIVQEVRAKRVLDRLAILNAPRARVVRDGAAQEVAAETVVIDDLLLLAPGDQVVVDGVLVEAAGLLIDESLLTGESEPVGKDAGDEVLAGSLVVGGDGLMRATRIGDDAYGNRLAAEARRFKLVASELRQGIDRFLRLITWAIAPVGGLLILGQLRANGRLVDAARSSVAGLVAMVPEGLVLLTSVAFAIAVVRLGRRHVLVQELPAVEMLARVDVVCLDKTGTLTDGRLRLDRVRPLGAVEEWRDALGAVAGADPHPNASLAAVAEAFPMPPGWAQIAAVPFSSARKWSGVTFAERGSWVIGAPDVLLSTGHGGALAEAQEAARAGRRVLLLGRSAEQLTEEPPRGLEPAALVVLAESIRPDAAATLEYFRRQDVALKVISGDNPLTAAAVAAAVGLPGTEDPVDARTAPLDGPDLGAVLEAHTVFGRVTPQQKRDMVNALRARGHIVAMTGDGVNDVLALKDSDIGVAMGSGSAAARAVARLVLLDSSFANLPAAIAEGRRVIANIERVASLFLTKTVYAMLLALSVATAVLPFPLHARQLTLVGGVSIGTPSFFLALASRAPRARSGFVPRTLRFAVPAGVVCATATFTGYALALDQGTDLPQARTLATLTLACIGLWLLVVLVRPLTWARGGLVGAMTLLLAGAVGVPPARRFFALELPPLEDCLTAITVVVCAILAIEVGWRVAGTVGDRRTRSPAPGETTADPSGRSETARRA